MQTVKTIGAAPWQRDELIAAVDEFAELYARRPIKDNAGGMKSPHMFATWFTARRLAPRHIIESGIWRGQSTWLLAQACPEAQLHSIDLNLSKREYISSSAKYHEIDFSEIDWSGIAADETLVFFDDHQNAYTRLQQCRWFGFRDIIFEDNHPPGSGDFYSLKQAFAEVGFGAGSLALPSLRYRSFPARLSRKVIATAHKFGLKSLTAIPQYNRTVILPNAADAHYLEQHLEVYAEFPPLFANGRMGLDGAEARGKHATTTPLLIEAQQNAYPDLHAEADSYNWICYTRLKQQAQ